MDDDKRRLDQVETKNKAEQLVYQTEKQIGELGEKIPADAKVKIEASLERLKSLKDSDNTDEIKSAMTQLEQEWNAIAQDLYSQDGSGPEASSAGAQGPQAASEPEVEDADFEVVDDDDSDDDKKKKK